MRFSTENTSTKCYYLREDKLGINHIHSTVQNIMLVCNSSKLCVEPEQDDQNIKLVCNSSKLCVEPEQDDQNIKLVCVKFVLG